MESGVGVSGAEAVREVNPEGAKFALSLFHSVASIAKKARIHREALSVAAKALTGAHGRLKVPVMWLDAAAARLNSRARRTDDVAAQLQVAFAAVASSMRCIRRVLQSMSTAFSLFGEVAWVLHSSPLLRSAALGQWLQGKHSLLLQHCRTFVKVRGVAGTGWRGVHSPRPCSAPPLAGGHRVCEARARQHSHRRNATSTQPL